MRRRFGTALRLGVSHAGMALVKTSRWGGERLALLGEYAFPAGEGAGAAQVALGMRALLADGSWARWPLTVVVGDELARIWQVTPPPGSTRLADLEAACALRFQALYGESAAGWRIAAGWDARRGFMAAALPAALADALHAAAAEHRLALVEMAPQFVAGWNRNCGQVTAGCWYGQVHDNVLTLGVTAGDGVAAVRAAPIPAGADAAWLTAHVAREVLRLGVPEPEGLQMSGQVPPSWQPMVDALPGPGPGWSGAAALAATGTRA